MTYSRSADISPKMFSRIPKYLNGVLGKICLGLCPPILRPCVVIGVIGNYNLKSAALDNLMKLTGLEDVKEKAVIVVKEVLVSSSRPDSIDASTSANFLFTGNPGCGKTTVAKLLAVAARVALASKATLEPCRATRVCTSVHSYEQRLA